MLRFPQHIIEIHLIKSTKVVNEREGKERNIKTRILAMKRVEIGALFYLILRAIISFPQAGLAADKALDKAELAKKSLNPIAALISLPVQFNYDSDIGPSDDGEKIVINIQPVIPISLSPEWNLISRRLHK
jgi:hypothetical protein